MKHISFIVSLVLAVLVSACGGSGGSSSPQLAASAPVTTVERINGIVVPPDPGAAKDVTLAGVDKDGNGIRDEIDRWIATQYGNKPGALEAIRLNARTSQKSLTSVPTTKEQALSISYLEFDLGICTGPILEKEGVNANHFFNEQFLRTYNTRNRLEVTNTINSLAGMIIRPVEDSFAKCEMLK